jgi:hypothetical protein
MRFYVKIYDSDWNGGKPIPTTLKHASYYSLEEATEIFGFSEHWLVGKGFGLIYDGEFCLDDWLKVVAIPEHIMVLQ